MDADVDEWCFYPGVRRFGHLQLTVKITKLYICDHEKNAKCKKTGCWYLDRGECFQTFDKEFEKEEN